MKNETIALWIIAGGFVLMVVILATGLVLQYLM